MALISPCFLAHQRGITLLRKSATSPESSLMMVTESPLKKRETKAERRARQRLENAGRAKEMHIARLKAEKEPTLFQSSEPKNGYYIGCSGWYYRHWEGLFYQTGSPSSQWFAHYKKNFKTVELNAPFYSWPKVTTVKTWIRQAGDDDFVYTVKVSELITHVKKFQRTKMLVKDFYYIADLLGDRLGCFLFQLPPSYKYTPARLKSIVSQLDPKQRNVVEFRHASWWNEKVYDAFRKQNIAFCSCSGPKLPEELIVTADDVYIRFHGITRWYRHDYSTEELQKWAEWIRQSKAKRVWVYFNNDGNAFAIKNAKELMRLLKK